MAEGALPFLGWLTESDEGRPCLWDDGCGKWLDYGGLAQRARAFSAAWAGPKALVFLYARNDIATVAALLGALGAGHAVALLDPAMAPGARDALTRIYRPDFVLAATNPNEIERAPGAVEPINPALAVLLSTSGSTGSPKFVRLTLQALEANARAIGVALEIGRDDVAAAHLPLHYSFGLATLTSHLARGARIRLTEMGFMDRGFWPAMRDAGVTHLPGVPFHFQMMQKLGYARLRLPDLASLAQAGGFLEVSGRRAAHDFMAGRGGRFYVMYGQTEASPRITTLPHADFPDAPESVGKALAGGRLEILEPDPTGRGEVVYHGPNVMMGYAETRADLVKGDEQQGRLLTGDIGFLDPAGRLTLTGRSKRFGKVYGLRVNLDEVERLANEVCEAAVVQAGEGIRILFATTGVVDEDGRRAEQVLARLSERYTIPKSAYSVAPIDAIPRTERGKVDYRAIEALS